MYYEMTSSDHRSINIAIERVATIDETQSFGGALHFFDCMMPSGGLYLRISVGDNWICIEGHPVRNNRIDWRTSKIYARQTSTSEDRSELDKALSILRWIFDLKTSDASPVGVIRRK